MKVGPVIPQSNNSSSADVSSATGDAFKSRVRSKAVTARSTPPPRPTTPAPTRRSGDSGTHHGPVRTVNVDTPVGVRTASNVQRQSQEGSDQASQALPASPIGARKATVSVEQLMSDVFDALEAGDASGVLASSKAFVAAVHTRDLRMAKTPAFSFDTHSAGWQSHLRAMPQDTLESVQQAAAGMSGHAADPVISGLHTAASSELLMRTARDIGSHGVDFVLGALSRDQLRGLRNAASQILNNAPQPLPGADPTARVPGTQFTRNGLETLLSGLNKQLAIKAVLANYMFPADALTRMPKVEIDECMWAVKWCKDNAVAVQQKTEFDGAKLAQSDVTWKSKLDGLALALAELVAGSGAATSTQRANHSGL